MAEDKVSSAQGEAPAMLVSSIARSRSVREAIQEVKMVQVWFLIIGPDVSFSLPFHYHMIMSSLESEEISCSKYLNWSLASAFGANEIAGS